MMGEFVSHPDEVLPMLKLKLKLMNTRKKIPRDPHWRFCYSMLNKVSSSFGFLIQQFDDELRDAVCIFFLVLEALDTIEDDSSIPANVKLPNLIGFHKYIYDRQWHFSCGTKDCKVLMDQFHHVLTAFLELEIGYQQVIEDFTKQVGAGMAKFIYKKVESIDDYDEYCHDTAGHIAVGLSKLFHACGLEDLPPPHLSNSMGLFLQKADIVQDYLEDINETPKPRMFWPREIWTKYVKKLEDLKYEQNSEKAVHCLNEMVTNALIHVEDCILYMSALKNPTIFRFWAIPQIKSLGTLVICYNNTQVFKDKVKMRRGLTAKIIDRTKTMDDVYGAIFDFTWMLKTKIKKNDPNATKTLSRIVEIQKICRNPGYLGKRKLYVLGCEPRTDLALVKVIFIILVVLLAWLSTYQPYN